jgi:hypothetical protein
LDRVLTRLSQGQQYITEQSGIRKQAALGVLGGLKCKNLGSACLPKLPLLGFLDHGETRNTLAAATEVPATEVL